MQDTTPRESMINGGSVQSASVSSPPGGPTARFRERLRAEGVRVSRSRSDMLFRAGEPASEVYLLDDGVVGNTHRDSSNARVILGIMVPPALIVPALHLDRTARYSAECLSECKLYVLSRSAVERMAEAESFVGLTIHEQLGKTIDRAHSHLVNVLSNHGIARVANLLLMLDADFRRFSSNQGKANRSKHWIDISQIDLAATLGMTPVYLNQILKGMKDSGAIRIASGKIKSINYELINKFA